MLQYLRRLELSLKHQYIPLAQYQRKWIFNHKDLPVNELDKPLIKPLTQQSAMKVWDQLISNKCSTPDQLTKGDWPSNNRCWTKTINWMEPWESDDSALPETIAEFIQWPAESLVYFCYEKYQIIETTWQVFSHNWKCFLFFDNGPILVSPENDQALMFTQDGLVKLGKRRK